MYTLPLSPPEAVPIGHSCFSFAENERGQVVYFSNLEPYDFHDVDDRGAWLLRAARLAESGVRRADIRMAFGLSRTTLQRSVNRLRDEGEAGFLQFCPVRGVSAITGEMKERATRLLAEGMSGAAVARELGLSKETLNYNRRRGHLAPAGSGDGAAARGLRPCREVPALSAATKEQALDLLAEGRSDAAVARALGLSKEMLQAHRRKGHLPSAGPVGGSGVSGVRPGGSGRVVITQEIREEADRLLAEGKSVSAAARELGVNAATLNYHRRKGSIGAARPEAATAGSGPDASEKPDGPQEASMPACDTEVCGSPAPRPLDRAARDDRDRSAPMGRGARDGMGRVAAAVGRLSEAQPRFAEALSAVAHGGVLAALPALLREGLLKHAPAFLSLPKGYYGVTSILLLQAFLLLARVRNAEALRYQSPGEWGAILGLDRCPEVKTLRSKVRALAADAERLMAWQGALARDWCAEDPEATATLSVDGHVKVYTGRKGRLPKHFVSRQKLCLPASVSYWVHALGGRPLLCLHKNLDPTLTRALERDVLPALEELGVAGPDAPDLTTADMAVPALTLVFDREGWSPALFRRLARRGIAVITWHKNFKGKDWPEEEFSLETVPIHGPGGDRTSDIWLAEKRIRLHDGPEVRQIRRRLNDGRQIALITTDFRLSRARVASALFSRWSQENFFKYAREEFHLDSLPVHSLVPQDPDAQVINPDWRNRDRELRRSRQALGTLRNRIAERERKPEPSNAILRKVGQLQAEKETLEAKIKTLQQERKETPKHVRVKDLRDDQALDALASRERHWLDILRMIAYRAETRMMAAVAREQGKKQRPRRHLRALLQADADILPDPERGILRVRILGTACNASDDAIAELLQELNDTRTRFPGTELRMVYELPEKPA